MKRPAPNKLKIMAAPLLIAIVGWLMGAWSTAWACNFATSIVSVSPSSGCVTAGENLTVTVNMTCTGGSGIDYAFAFTDNNGLGGSNQAWEGAAGDTTCDANPKVNNPFTATGAQSWPQVVNITVPSTSFNITKLYLVALTGGRPYCNGTGGTVTDNISLAACTPTLTPAPCISNDTPTYSYNTSITSSGISLAHSLTGTNRFLLVQVFLGPETTGATVKTCTYGGVTLTKALQQMDTGSNNHGDTETWYLAAPPAGRGLLWSIAMSQPA